MNKRSDRLRAFTTTELMICVLIVVILASLLLPAFQKAKSWSKTTVCLSNLRQLYAALKLYQSDYGEYPPNSVVWPGFRSCYPKVLSCPNGKGLPEFHYLLVASPLGLSDGHASFDQCREKRQGDIPLAVDMNHIGREIHPKNPMPVLVVRENGSVERTYPQRRLSSPPPCSSKLYMLNF